MERIKIVFSSDVVMGAKRDFLRRYGPDDPSCLTGTCDDSAHSCEDYDLHDNADCSKTSMQRSARSLRRGGLCEKFKQLPS